MQAEKKAHTVLAETHSRANELMMGSSTRRCQGKEYPVVVAEDSLKIWRTVA